VHTNCASNTPLGLPTRVIDVGPSDSTGGDGSGYPRILVPQGLKAPYIALSHCWGGPVSSLLTSKTIGAFQDELIYSTLPANFRDAITITRKLNIRYLWIDTLCILQDSSEDWAKESANMGLVYRKSALTIFAISSERSTCGILQPFPKASPKQNVTLRVASSGAARGDVTVVAELPHSSHEVLAALVFNSPLSNRGWALQELTMSPRRLYYGRDQAHWGCRQAYNSLDGCTWPINLLYGSSPETEAYLQSDILRQPLLGIPGIHILLRGYYFLVQQYTSCRLTNRNDKLPALSGLSARLHRALGGQHVAGLWSIDLARGLLWDSISSSERPPSSTFRAPSWSWAATDDTVAYDRWNFECFPSLIKLTDCKVELAEQSNPYGEVIAARLLVEGLAAPLVRGSPADHVWRGQPPMYVGYANFDKEMKRWGDHRPLWLETADKGCQLVIGYSKHGVKGSDPTDFEDLDIDLGQSPALQYVALLVSHAPKEWGRSPARGLVLQPDASGRLYKRVGRFAMDVLPYENASIDPGPEENRYRRQGWRTQAMTLV